MPETPLNLTADQVSTLTWLRVQAPGCAEAFEAALSLVSRGRATGVGSLIAHCLRDMLNRLGETFTGTKAEQVQYRDLIRSLVLAIDTAGFSTQPPHEEAGPQTTVPIPVSVLAPLDRLILDSRRGEERDDDKETAIFVGLCGARGGQKEFEPGRSALRNLRQWAQRKAHFTSHKVRDVPFAEAEQKVREVEALFLALRRKFYEQAKELDAILDIANA